MFSSIFGSSQAEGSDVIYPELPTPKNKEDYMKIIEENKKKIATLFKEKEGWTAVENWDTENPDIVSFEKADPNSAVHIVKATGIVNISPSELVSKVAIYDLEKRKQMDNEVLEFKVLEDLAEHIKVLRTVYSAPYPVTSREFITISCLDKLDDPSAVIYFGVSINYPSVKYTSSLVRGSVVAIWLFENVQGNDNQTRVTRMVQMDPKGSVPTFVVNMAKSKPAAHIVTLRKLFGKK